MAEKLAEKASVLVTGSSSGIGAATARVFSKNGYHVILAGRSETKLREVQKSCAGSTSLISFDLKNVKQHFPEIQKILSLAPPLEILVNNAGTFKTGSFEELSIDSWQEQFQVNFFSAVQLTQFIWPYFKKNKKGSILNISSTLGTQPTAGTGAYSASKAAMNNWTLNLAQEGEGLNIRANAICPGIVDTPIHSFHSLSDADKKKQSESIFDLQLLKALGSAEDIARAAYFLASDDSKWTTGSILTIDGGISLK